MIAFPEPRPTRPIWLVTLADLALLLVGCFALIEATRHQDRAALVAGLRQGFGGAPEIPRATPREPPMPLAAAMASFPIGSARPGGASGDLLAWARSAAADPRVMLTVTGSVDGSAADVDPATGSRAVLAADRARAVAALIAPAAPRLSIAIADAPGRRTAMVTLAFAGEPVRRP